VVRLGRLAAEPHLLRGASMLVVAGGFSHADAFGAGRMFALGLTSALGDELAEFVGTGRPVLGICNGFQILCETGLLPGVLMRNAGLKFICKMQHLKVGRTDTAFTSHYSTGDIIKVAIAHGEANYVADAETIARRAMAIAAEICVYTNGNLTIESISP
jgi:phosphoribosylformylglycinamidine synthase